MIPGKIVIKDNKVYFEPDGLKKPKSKFDLLNLGIYQKSVIKKQWEIYEASKRIIEVSNKYWWKESKYWIYKNNILMVINKEMKEMKNNQSCEAEVENDVAVIIKIN